MLTVGTLVEEMRLTLAAGDERADSAIRWVHITELLDPTPWLSGGELLLTTGIQLTAATEQRRFVRRLAAHGLSGLGFGTGFDHEHLPRALVEEAAQIGFPLFEVPYEMPFIAITEKAFGRLVNEQYEVLQRGVAIHKRLEQLVLEEAGLDAVARGLAETVQGTVAVFEPRGEVMTTGSYRRPLDQSAVKAVGAELGARAAQGRRGAFSPAEGQLPGGALALPIGGGPHGPEAWLVAVRDTGELLEFERLILQQAVTVVALELMRQRVMRDTERRLAGNVLAEALTGRLEAHELAVRLKPFGVGDSAAALVFHLADPPAAEAALDRLMSDLQVGALVAAREHLLCAIVDAGGRDPVELATEARTELAEQYGEVRAAASRPAPATAIRRSFHEARCALEAAALTNGSRPAVASHRDLGAFQLLLSLQDDEALALYCDSVLAPIEAAEGEYGDELLKSLEAFLEENGQWERAARRLFCHRHTLRYRIRRVEQLTGRDLRRAKDRIEFWLAMRGRELVR